MIIFIVFNVFLHIDEFYKYCIRQSIIIVHTIDTVRLRTSIAFVHAGG